MPLYKSDIPRFTVSICWYFPFKCSFFSYLKFLLVSCVAFFRLFALICVRLCHQGIYGTVRKHLKKTHTDTQIKFYKFVARPSLLCGTETWVTTKRDMARLEAAEMRFLRSIKRYTRLDKIRREVIRKELEISGIQDVRLKYKQNWINHLERMDNTRLPKHSLYYKPRGRRDRGRPRKRWQLVDAGTGQTT